MIARSDVRSGTVSPLQAVVPFRATLINAW